VARNRASRGIGFLLIVAVLIYGGICGAIALRTGRDCSDQGLAREWKWAPPGWECKNPTYVPVNN
jgi:hypothetical protein